MRENTLLQAHHLNWQRREIAESIARRNREDFKRLGYIPGYPGMTRPNGT